MEIEQEINISNPKRQEFAKLLDQDFKDRKLIENQIIKAKVVEILKAYVVCDAKAKSEAMIPISELGKILVEASRPSKTQHLFFFMKFL